MADTPRQRRKIQNRNKILDAAANLIISRGYENTSLRQIAKKADYSPAAIYKYFPSKEDIFLSLSSRENRKLLELLDTVDRSLPPKMIVIELCLLYIQFCLETPSFLTLINNLPSERRAKEQPVPPHSPYLVFLEAVQSWVDQEKIKLPENYDAEDITYALWSQIHGMATLKLNQLKDFEADFDRTNRQTLEIFLSGIQQW